jgi:RNA polymerase sigma factor (TIGR02999 family)
MKALTPSPMKPADDREEVLLPQAIKRVRGPKRAPVGEGGCIPLPRKRPANTGVASPPSDVSRRLMTPIEADEDCTGEKLMPVVYDQLRRLAAYELSKETQNRVFEAADLVHEAWLRLGADAQPAWKNRAQFVASAAEAMHRLLTDGARRRLRIKRGGGAVHVSLDAVELPAVATEDERLLAVDDALEKFAATNPRKAELVRLLYFSGMTFKEAASVLRIAVPTAKAWWACARAWLVVEVHQGCE